MIAFVLPSWYAFLLFAVLVFFGFSIFIWALFLLPAVGLAVITLVQSERQSWHHLMQLVWVALLLRNSSSLLESLIAKRAELQTKIRALVAEWLVKTKSKPILLGSEKKDFFKTFDRGL